MDVRLLPVLRLLVLHVVVVAVASSCGCVRGRASTIDVEFAHDAAMVMGEVVVVVCVDHPAVGMGHLTALARLRC